MRFLGLLILLLVVGCTTKTYLPAEKDATGNNIFISEEMGISLSYPSDWIAELDGREAVFLSPDGRSSLNVSLGSYLGVVNYDNFTTHFLLDSMGSEGVNFVEKKDESTFNRGDEEWLTFRAWLTLGNVTFYQKRGVFATGADGGKEFYYFIMSTDEKSFDEQARIFDSLLASVEFKR